MASKGQKFRKYDTDIKLKIIAEKQTGKSFSELSEKYGIPQGTVTNWVLGFRREGIVDVKKRGRPKASDEINYRERYEILKKYQDFLAKQGRKRK
ncbi:MAG TPA: helix-turn-helix domain-containing protein [Bacillota bacterium]|nr:helix-turn-helix domain-containing protein [Bacillota bacterium]HPJ23890.1 helix-turn-helix domain-containing protein [Bacillota bacterium]